MFSRITMCLRHEKSVDLLAFDHEIMIILRRIKRKKVQVFKLEQEAMANTRDNGKDYRLLHDYVMPVVSETFSGIQRPTIQANNFKIEATIIQMVQLC